MYYADAIRCESLHFSDRLLGIVLSQTVDLDFLVEFQPEAQVGFMKLAKMQRELSAVLNRKVDLVPKGGLKPKIRQAILSSAEVLYAS